MQRTITFKHLTMRKTLTKLILPAARMPEWTGAMCAQDTTTAAGVPMIRLNNGVEMPRFGRGTSLPTTGEMAQMRSLNREKRFFNMPPHEKTKAYLNTPMKD